MSPSHQLDQVQQWIAEHGRAWGPRVERLYDVRHMVQNACFANAIALMQRDLDLRYCEGVASFGGLQISIHHSWCVTSAGEVVDSTWPDGTDYFGVAFGRNYVSRRHARMHSKGRIGSLINPWDTDRDWRLLQGRVSRRAWEK